MLMVLESSWRICLGGGGGGEGTGLRNSSFFWPCASKISDLFCGGRGQRCHNNYKIESLE